MTILALFALKMCEASLTWRHPPVIPVLSRPRQEECVGGQPWHVVGFVRLQGRGPGFEFVLWDVWLSGPQSDMFDPSSRTFQIAPVPK